MTAELHILFLEDNSSTIRYIQNLRHPGVKFHMTNVLNPVGFADFMEVVKQVGVFWAVLNELPPERI